MVACSYAGGGASSALGLKIASSLLLNWSVWTSADWRFAWREAFLMRMMAGVLVMGHIGARKPASGEPAWIFRTTASLDILGIIVLAVSAPSLSVLLSESSWMKHSTAFRC